MTIATVITVTVAIMFWSLWIRRMTWKCSYEVAATFNITLQCLAVILMSPWASHTVGRWLYNITGDHNLEDYLAHDLYIIAASAIALNVVGKLGPEAQARFKRDVEMPATLAIPVMFLTFTAGAGVDEYRSDFFRVPTDASLSAYWLVMTAVTTYLLLYSCQALIPLRRNPETSGVATLYMLFAGFGVAACTIRAVTVFLPGHLQDTATASFPVWLTACACGAGFALISGLRWKQTLRDWFTSRETVLS